MCEDRAPANERCP